MLNKYVEKLNKIIENSLEDYSAAGNKIRKLLEELVEDLINQNKIIIKGKDELYDKINELRKNKKISKKEKNYMHNIRVLTNLDSHHNEDEEDEEDDLNASDIKILYKSFNALLESIFEVKIPKVSFNKDEIEADKKLVKEVKQNISKSIKYFIGYDFLEDFDARKYYEPFKTASEKFQEADFIFFNKNLESGKQELIEELEKFIWCVGMNTASSGYQGFKTVDNDFEAAECIKESMDSLCASYDKFIKNSKIILKDI